MTYLGSRYIDIHTWTTVGTRSAGHRGQRSGHLAKMYNSWLYSGLFEQHYIDLYTILTTLVLNMTYIGSK